MERRRSTNLPSGPKPRYNAVVASATRITRKRRLVRPAAQKWQEDAWRYYDSNGELRFAVGWIANGLSRVNLVAAVQSTDGVDPVPLRQPSGSGGYDGSSEPTLTAVETDAIRLVSEIGGGAEGQAQLLARLATLLTVPGIGWLLIEPKGKSKGDDGDQWSWRALSDDELKSDGNGGWLVEATDDDDTDERWRAIASDHVLVKVWRSHPRHAREPDSSCRAVIGVLRQLEMLDEHIEASAQSRLAGAGLLIVPEEVKFAPVVSGGESPDRDELDPDSDVSMIDDFMEVLIDSASTAIADRGSAAAMVPLAVTVPGEFVEGFKHLTFWSEFSETVIALSERAIKRFALGMDMPPEIVTGVSSMNHWGAWRVQEEAVTLHIEPLSEIICQAFTIGFLRPALIAMGHDEAEVDRVLVVGDTMELTVRPDRSADTRAAYDNIEVSGVALRRESGLSEDDKPSDEEWERRVLLRIADRNPEAAVFILPKLGIDIGLPTGDGAQPYPMRSLDGQRAEPDQPIGGAPAPSSGETDSRLSPPANDDPVAASAALLEAADGIVYRALERAGSRLRTAAGKNVPGGSAVVASCEPALMHTMIDAATFSDVRSLLDGALDRVPVVADRLGVDSDTLTASLHGYLRGLLVSGQGHDPDELESVLRPLVMA